VSDDYIYLVIAKGFCIRLYLHRTGVFWRTCTAAINEFPVGFHFDPNIDNH